MLGGFSTEVGVANHGVNSIWMQKETDKSLKGKAMTVVVGVSATLAKVEVGMWPVP